MIVDLKDTGPLFRRDPCAFLYQLAKSYPGQNAQFTIAGENLLVIQDFDDAEYILSTKNDIYFKNFSGLDFVLGRSRLTTDGDLWRRLQKLSQPFIARVTAAKLSQSTKEHYTKAVEQLCHLQQTGVRATDIMPFIDLAAASVLFDLLLKPETENFLNSLIATFRANLMMGAKISWTMGRESSPLSDREKTEFHRNRSEIDTVVRYLIPTSVEQTMSSELIQSLYGAKSEIDIVGELNSLIFAGFDTSSTAIGWGVFLLSIDPDLKTQIRKALTGIDFESEEGLDALLQNEVLHAFFLETLRIFPPVPFLSRVAAQKDQIKSLAIVEKQKILISIVGLHYDRTVYANPGEVHLDRWTKAGSDRRNFIPFGMGRRRCGGALFGEREFKVAIATLLEHLDFDAELRTPLAFNWYGTLRRQGGHVVNIRRNESKSQ